MDTLQPEKFGKVTRYGNFSRVWAGIRAAEEAGLLPIKINAVIVRGINDDELLDFAQLTLQHAWHVRFIEWMPVGAAAQDWRARVVSAAEIRAEVQRLFTGFGADGGNGLRGDVLALIQPVDGMPEILGKAWHRSECVLIALAVTARIDEQQRESRLMKRLLTYLRPYKGATSLAVLMLLVAALAQAGGAVLSRAALAGTQVSPLWSAVLRLAAGVVVLLAWLAAARRPLGGLRRGEGGGHLWAMVAGAILLGTYLALWLQQVSLQRVPAGIAQTLFATSPLFVLPLAAWSGERVSLRAVLGAAVALGGVGLLFAGG